MMILLKDDREQRLWDATFAATCAQVAAFEYFGKHWTVEDSAAAVIECRKLATAAANASVEALRLVIA